MWWRLINFNFFLLILIGKLYYERKQKVSPTLTATIIYLFGIIYSCHHLIYDYMVCECTESFWHFFSQVRNRYKKKFNDKQMRKWVGNVNFPIFSLWKHSFFFWHTNCHFKVQIQIIVFIYKKISFCINRTKFYLFVFLSFSFFFLLLVWMIFYFYYTAKM